MPKSKTLLHCDCGGCYQFKFSATGKFIRPRRRAETRRFPKSTVATLAAYKESYYRMNNLVFKGEPAC